MFKSLLRRLNLRTLAVSAAVLGLVCVPLLASADGNERFETGRAIGRVIGWVLDRLFNR